MVTFALKSKAEDCSDIEKNTIRKIYDCERISTPKLTLKYLCEHFPKSLKYDMMFQEIPRQLNKGWLFGMEIVEQVQNGFPDGKKSEHSDTISFKEWVESWYNRKCSGDWMSELRSEADDLFVEVNELKWNYIRNLYGKIIARLNVLLKLEISANGIFDLNDMAIEDEMYHKMFEYLYDDKKLFWSLNPKEVELFELLLTVMDEDKYIPDSLKKDKWECIDLADREKICDVLNYLVWNLGWDEHHFVTLGLVPRNSVHPNPFRIVGRSVSFYYDDSSLKYRAFCDYDIRLLHPKEYRLSCSLDHIYTIVEDIESYASEQEYEEALDRTISEADKIWKGLEEWDAGRIKSIKKGIDKLLSKK